MPGLNGSKWIDGMLFSLTAVGVLLMSAVTWALSFGGRLQVTEERINNAHPQLDRRVEWIERETTGQEREMHYIRQMLERIDADLRQHHRERDLEHERDR